LMRRALVGIVPNALLERKRKAFVVRGPFVWLRENWSAFVEMNREMVSAKLGVLDEKRFIREVEWACQGKEAAVVPIFRTLVVELWLKKLSSQGVLRGPLFMDESKSALTRGKDILSQPVSKQEFS